MRAYVNVCVVASVEMCPCVCVCVCVRACMRAHECVLASAFVSVWANVCSCRCALVSMSVRMRVHVCQLMRALARACVLMHVTLASII